MKGWISRPKRYYNYRQLVGLQAEAKAATELGVRPEGEELT